MNTIYTLAQNTHFWSFSSSLLYMYLFCPQGPIRAYRHSDHKIVTFVSWY